MHPENYPIPVDGDPDAWKSMYGRAPTLWDWIIGEFGDQGYEDCAALYQLVTEGGTKPMAVERDDPRLTGGTECYAIDTAASWYHAEWCHSFDHHEWIHAELERRKKYEADAYEAANAARELFHRAVGMLREVRAAEGVRPELAAKVTTFLAGADRHEALKNFMDGTE